MDIDFNNSSRKPNVFTVPEGFFEQNSRAVMSRVTRSRRITLIRRAAVTAAAAAVAVVALMQPWGVDNPLTHEQKIDMLISESTDSQLNDAVVLADAESLFDTELFYNF